MKFFHKLIDLIDKNAKHIPEGDYVEMCNVIKDIRGKVKPLRFFKEQDERETPVRAMSLDEIRSYLEELHEEWTYGDISAEEAMQHLTHLL